MKSENQLFNEASEHSVLLYDDVKLLLQKKYGKEWVDSHEEVIAILTTSAAMDFHTMMASQALEKLNSNLEEITRMIGND